MADTIRITVPAVIGTKSATHVFEELIEAAENTLRSGSLRSPSVGALPRADGPSPVDHIAESFPEYVLGPSNPLTFLAPDMPCSFFNVD